MFGVRFSLFDSSGRGDEKIPMNRREDALTVS